MPKKLLFTVACVLFLAMPLCIALEEQCKEITTLRDIPCVVTSAWKYPNCSVENVSVYDQNGINVANYTVGDFDGEDLCYFNYTYKALGSYDFVVTNGDSGNVLVESGNMIGMMIGMVIFIVFFGIVGYMNKKFWPSFLGYSLMIVEIIMVAAFMYANELGTDITPLLRINFYVMAIIGFGLAMISFFMASVRIAVPEDDGASLQKGDKWEGNSRGKW